MCRALGRLRTTLGEPSVALPHKFRHRAQQKRLAAIRHAVTSLRLTVEFLRSLVDVRRTQQDADAPLLDELCAAVPAAADAPCALVESLEDVVREDAGAGKGGKKGAEAVLRLNSALFVDYDGSGEEEVRLAAEIPLATEIMGSLLEHTSVRLCPRRLCRGSAGVKLQELLPASRWALLSLGVCTAMQYRSVLTELTV